MRTLFPSLLLASLALCSVAAAEDDIVVTATRTPTALSRLPARVDVIQRDDIEAQSLTSLTEAIGSQAVQSGGAGQQASVFLRGGNSKHTLALFDGVRLNDPSTPNAQYDFGLDSLGGIDRVEVLRGPASTIYGTDAIGGVVNMIPRRGGETAFEPFVEASVGSFETLRGLAGAAGEANSIAYGVSVETYDSEGYDLIPRRMATRTGDPDGARVTTLIGSARADLGGYALDALVRVRDALTEYDTFSGGPFFSLRADDPDLEAEATQTLWRLGGESEGAPLTFHVSAGQVLSERTENDGGAQTTAADSTRSFADAEARLVRGETTLSGGLSFAREDIDTSPQFANPLSIAEDQMAAYLIAQSRLAPFLDATASLRVDDYESFGTHTTYALGLVANWAPVRVFASYGTAFKAPSLSERYELSFFNVGNPDLDPEESRSWEVGADWAALPDDALTLGVSYYQTRIRDLIEYDFGQLKNVNIGRAAIDGGEIYVEAAPASWASLRLTYAITDARNDVTNALLVRRPPQAWELKGDVRPMERLTLSASWRHVGARRDVTYDDAGDFVSGSGRVPAFDVGAIAVTFDLTERAQLFARIENITDETYEQPAAFAGAPRSAQVGVRAKF